MLHTINSGGSWFTAMSFFTASLCLSVAPNAIMIPYICERFHTTVRASGYGVGYTLAVLIPGLYSFMLVWMSSVIPYEYGTVVLLALGGVCMVAGAALGPETKDVDLSKQVSTPCLTGVAAAGTARTSGVKQMLPGRSFHTGGPPAPRDLVSSGWPGIECPGGVPCAGQVDSAGFLSRPVVPSRPASSDSSAARTSATSCR
jgi:hypothetical protein